MDVRTELRELRAEFKELAKQPNQPRADITQTGERPREWRVCGCSYPIGKQFTALADRAAALMGLQGCDEWLDSLSKDNGLNDADDSGYGVTNGKPDGTRYFIGTLLGIAGLSVLAIDKALAKMPLVQFREFSPPAPPAVARFDDEQLALLVAGLKATDNASTNEADAEPPNETPFTEIIEIFEGRFPSGLPALRQFLKDHPEIHRVTRGRRSWADVGAIARTIAAESKRTSEREVESMMEGIAARKAAIDERKGRIRSA